MREDDEPAHSPDRVTSLLPGRQSPGEDMGRILSLTDGVFAFSLTLLVLSLVVPVFPVSGKSVEEISGRLGFLLSQHLGAFLGYVFVFVMIAIWWTAHHRVFRWIVRYDDILVWLNLAVLLEIAVMPFVLNVYINYSDTRVAVILFALIECATGLTLALLWFYASWHHRLIRRSVPVSEVRWMQGRLFLTPLVFAISIGVAFVSLTGAEVVWIGVLVVQRFTWYSQAMRAIRAAPPPPEP